MFLANRKRRGPVRANLIFRKKIKEPTYKVYYQSEILIEKFTWKAKPMRNDSQSIAENMVENDLSDI